MSLIVGIMAFTDLTLICSELIWMIKSICDKELCFCERLLSWRRDKELNENKRESIEEKDQLN